MGIIIGTWRLPSFSLQKDEPVTPETIARRLRAATGLTIELQTDGGLRIPSLREKLFDWETEGRSVTVYGYVPAHPYVWENLDAVMTSFGGERDDDAGYKWQPNPAHARLRTKWSALPPRDRFILAMPSIIGARPFDGLLLSLA